MGKKKKNKKTWMRVENSIIAVPLQEANYIEFGKDEEVWAIRFYRHGREITPFYCIPCGIATPVPNEVILARIFEQLSRKLTHG